VAGQLRYDLFRYMVEFVHSRKDELTRICEEFGVLRLALFGSAARSDFNPETSDLDFLVEFCPMPPREHAQSYCGLMHELERLFKRNIDLVEASAVRNPYIRRNIHATRVPVYAA
jgi:predicted nucleotidyltransferase